MLYDVRRDLMTAIKRVKSRLDRVGQEDCWNPSSFSEFEHGILSAVRDEHQGGRVGAFTQKGQGVLQEHAGQGCNLVDGRGSSEPDVQREHRTLREADQPDLGWSELLFGGLEQPLDSLARCSHLMVFLIRGIKGKGVGRREVRTLGWTASPPGSPAPGVQRSVWQQEAPLRRSEGPRERNQVVISSPEAMKQDQEIATAFVVVKRSRSAYLESSPIEGGSLVRGRSCRGRLRFGFRRGNGGPSLCSWLRATSQAQSE